MLQKLTQKSNFAFALGLALLFGSAFLFYVSYRSWGEWSYDQGFYLLVADLLNRDFALYTDIFMSEPPLMAWSVRWPLAVFGTVAGMQLVMIGYGMLAIAATVVIGAILRQRWVGLLGAALLAWNYSFFFSARKVMPEIPAMSLAILAIALALYYQKTGHRRWLVFSGAAMAGSALIKLLMPAVVPLILLILLVPPQQSLAFNQADLSRWLKNWFQWLKTGAVWFASFGAVVLAAILPYNFKALFEQVIVFHLLKSGVSTFSLVGNISLLWGQLGAYPVLLALALLGLGIAVARFWQSGWVMVLWTAFTLAFVLFYTPLYSKHLVILYPIMGLLAASFLYDLLTVAQGQLTQNKVWRVGGGLFGVTLSLALVFDMGGHFWQNLDKPHELMIPAEQQPIVAMIEQFTSPADCLITDNPYLPVVTQRLIPPWFSGLSYARFDNNSLQHAEMISISQQAGCQVMAPILDRVKNTRRPFYDWGKQNYLYTWIVDGKEVMLGYPLDKNEAQPHTPLAANFANQVELLGADWFAGAESGHISLYWRVRQPLTEDYKIFVQLRDNAGQVISSADHEAYDGLIPTTRWPLERIFKETNRLIWPADTPPGTYTLYVGLYDPASPTFDRLPIVGDQSGENAVLIPGIVVP